MKFVPFGKATKSISGNGNQGIIAWEYETGDSAHNIAKVKIIGRYPDKERKVNRISKMKIIVIDGRGEVIVEGVKVELTSGDMIEIDKEEKYFWIARPYIVLAITSSPAWKPEQCESVI